MRKQFKITIINTWGTWWDRRSGDTCSHFRDSNILVWKPFFTIQFLFTCTIFRPPPTVPSTNNNILQRMFYKSSKLTWRPWYFTINELDTRDLQPPENIDWAPASGCRLTSNRPVSPGRRSSLTEAQLLLCQQGSRLGWKWRIRIVLKLALAELTLLTPQSWRQRWVTGIDCTITPGQRSVRIIHLAVLSVGHQDLFAGYDEAVLLKTGRGGHTRRVTAPLLLRCNNRNVRGLERRDPPTETPGGWHLSVSQAWEILFFDWLLCRLEESSVAQQFIGTDDIAQWEILSQLLVIPCHFSVQHSSPVVLISKDIIILTEHHKMITSVGIVSPNIPDLLRADKMSGCILLNSWPSAPSSTIPFSPCTVNLSYQVPLALQEFSN